MFVTCVPEGEAPGTVNSPIACAETGRRDRLLGFNTFSGLNSDFSSEG